MIVPQQYKCDSMGCEAVHTETNKWWVVQVESHGLYLFTWEQAIANNRLDRGNHFCGAAHALQFVSSEMGNQKEWK